MNARWHSLLSQRWQHVQALGDGTVPPSPCLSVCLMNPQTHTCLGCLRTLDEIARWGRASASEQQAIWRAVGQRLVLEKADAPKPMGEAF